ncbi:MAG: helix-turn-helix domain-containing protein [Gemmatimonadales bacterium]
MATVELTSSEAALAAGEGRERVVRLVQRGVLAGRCVGGRYLIDRASLERWLAQRAAADEPAGAA